MAVDAWLSARWNKIVRREALHSTATLLGVAALRRQPYRHNRQSTIRAAPHAVASTPVRWDRLTLGLGFGFALLAWSMGFGAMLPELRDEVSMSSSVAAIHGSLFGIFLLLFSVLGSHFFATRSNRLSLGISLVAMVVGSTLFGFGYSPAMTLAGAGFAGAGAAVFVIVAPAVIFAHQAHDSTRVVATLNTFPMASGTLLPVAISLAIATGVSWRISYLVPIAVIGIGMAWCIGRSAVPKDHLAEPVPLGEIFRLPDMARRWVAMVCGVLAEIATGLWAASIMREQAGASKSAAASLTIGFFIGMAVGRLSLSNLLRRFAPRRILVYCFSGAIVACVPFLLGPGLIARVIGLFLMGLAISAIYPLSVSRMFELSHDTAALGRAAALGSGVGVTFGPLLLGACSDLVGLGWATAILPVFLTGGLLAALRRDPPSSSAQAQFSA